ncbi:hypothetical protein HID58_087221, partial [Brassica napus]
YMVPKVRYHSYTEDTGVEVSRTCRDQVELAGRADSRDGRTRRRTQPRDGSDRRRADHATVQIAGELTGAMAELAGRLTGVMVELAGELTRMTVQLSGEWLLCGICSFVHFRSFFQ